MTRPAIVLLIAAERARAVCSLLLRHEGYHVLEARDADHVIELARAHNASLVIADLPDVYRPVLRDALTFAAPAAECMFVHEMQALKTLESILGKRTDEEPPAPGATSLN